MTARRRTIIAQHVNVPHFLLENYRYKPGHTDRAIYFIQGHYYCCGVERPKTKPDRELGDGWALIKPLLWRSRESGEEPETTRPPSACLTKRNLLIAALVLNGSSIKTEATVNKLSVNRTRVIFRKTLETLNPVIFKTWEAVIKPENNNLILWARANKEFFLPKIDRLLNEQHPNQTS